MQFFLGTHQVHWLSKVDVPLFVSHRRLRRYKTLPKAKAPWSLDSGGFSELSLHGKWVTTHDEYVTAVRRYKAEVGNLQWAAPRDYMCEPVMIANTGLSVREHQYRTVESVIRLRTQSPDCPIICVLQGWKLRDYLNCIELYRGARIDLTKEPVVGVGSVCRRQATEEIGRIFETLHGQGLRLHGFGVKTAGLKLYGRYLTSADSLAWSFGGRRAGPCVHGSRAKSESNCLAWALQWREKVLKDCYGA